MVLSSSHRFSVVPTGSQWFSVVPTGSQGSSVVSTYPLCFLGIVISGSWQFPARFRGHWSGASTNTQPSLTTTLLHKVHFDCSNGSFLVQEATTQRSLWAEPCYIFPVVLGSSHLFSVVLTGSLCVVISLMVPYVSWL